MDSNAHEKFAGKTLVVFGAGYVGGEVARRGVALGMSVVALTRNAKHARELEASGVEVLVAELSTNVWHGKIGAADFVVYCASAGGGGVEGYRRSYVGGMKSVVAWMRGHLPSANPQPRPLSQGEKGGARGMAAGFVYTSSTSVYPQTGGIIVREGDEAGGAGGAPITDNPRKVLSRVPSPASQVPHPGSRFPSPATPGVPRAQLLLEAERLALGGGACVLRLAGIYGPGRHALLNQLRAGTAVLPGRADSRLNLIHRDDAMAAIWAVLERGDAGGEIFNVCDDEPCLRGEVAGWLARRLGVAAPAFSGVAARGTARGGLDRVVSNEKLKTRTGWRPRFTSFREGYAGLLGG